MMRSIIQDIEKIWRIENMEPIPHWDGNYFTVKSSKGKGEYRIWHSKSMDRWICTCPHWGYRCMTSGKDCKHIKAVREYIGGEA